MSHTSLSSVSVIIPVFNECESLSELCGQVCDVLRSLPGEHEILFIDDASTDKSRTVLRELSEQKGVRAFRLMFNSKKSGALQVGFHEAKGDVIITLDGDLQDDPAEIPRLLTQLEAGADMVNTWKKERCDAWHKKLFSRIINAMAAFCFKTAFKDMNTGFKGYKSPTARSLLLRGGQYRFIPHVLAARGFEVSEIPVSHRPRKYGKTKFGLCHRAKALIDLCIAWFAFGLERHWMRALVWIACLMIVTGMSFLLYLFATWLGADYPRMRPMLIGGVFLVLLGTQMLTLLLLARVHVSGRGHIELPAYEEIMSP